MSRKRKGAPKKPDAVITSIFVRGFKSLRDLTEIEIRPLTLLAGRNSSGKSSLMQAMLLIKQTLDAPFDPGPLWLDGENVKFTAADQMFWSGKPSDGEEIEIGCTTSGEYARVSLVFRRAQRGMALDRISYTDDAGAHELREDMTAGELRALVPEDFRLALGETSYAVERSRCLLSVGVPEMRFSWESPATVLEMPLAQMLHLPGHRGNPERSYPSTAVGMRFPGVFQPYTASAIAGWQEARDPRLAELGRQLADLGLTWKVNARWINDAQLELQVGRLPYAAKGSAKDLVNIADVGFGVSQTLPLLVALLLAEPGQLVYVEQPEIHLHPKAQVALARCLLEAAARGVLIIAETHSNLLLKGVQLEVAAGRANPELVKLHWFERDKQGATKVTSADLDEQGAFGPWPEDFADVELDVEEKYLRASMRAATE